MRLHNILRGVCLVLAAFYADSAIAAGRVEMVILGVQQPSSDFHEWARLLDRCGAARVQIRSPQGRDKLEVEVVGSADRPTYVVTGMFASSGELVVPGARFRRSDSVALAQWIKDLGENGPQDQREAKSALGLTAAQTEHVRTDLAQPVGFSTAGQDRAEVVRRITAQLHLTTRIDPDAANALGGDKVAEELSEFACGTALACVLRPAGCCFAPQSRGRELSYAMALAKSGQEVWPIGSKPEKPAKDVLPVLFEFLTVNIQGVSAAKAMDALGKRMKVPLLVDHNALARYGIDPEKITVSSPQGRTTYSLILQRILFQARLKQELRVDEAGKPFLWITTIKAM